LGYCFYGTGDELTATPEEGASRPGSRAGFFAAGSPALSLPISHPHRINNRQFAKKRGISKAAAIEHLREAEAQLFAALLDGY
jgi:hypothetical protein